MNRKSDAQKDADLRKRIERYTVKKGPDDCWPWIGPMAGKGWRERKGYGQLTVKGGKLLVTRIVYADHFGVTIPADIEVCHTCDFPPCMNPAHFFLGDSHANHDDMARKDRGTWTIHKADVLRIIGLREAGQTYSAIAECIGVSKSAVAHIVKRRTRKHITKDHYHETG